MLGIPGKVVKCYARGRSALDGIRRRTKSTSIAAAIADRQRANRVSAAVRMK